MKKIKREEKGKGKRKGKEKRKEGKGKRGKEEGETGISTALNSIGYKPAIISHTNPNLSSFSSACSTVVHKILSLS